MCCSSSPNPRNETSLLWPENLTSDPCPWAKFLWFDIWSSYGIFPYNVVIETTDDFAMMGHCADFEIWAKFHRSQF